MCLRLRLLTSLLLLLLQLLVVKVTCQFNWHDNQPEGLLSGIYRTYLYVSCRIDRVCEILFTKVALVHSISYYDADPEFVEESREVFMLSPKANAGCRSCSGGEWARNEVPRGC